MNGVSYARLRDGTWGLRASEPGALAPGETVLVRRRDGASKYEVVGRVLCEGPSFALATIRRPSRRPESRRQGWGCRRCGGPLRDTRTGPSTDCECGDCAAR